MVGDSVTQILIGLVLAVLIALFWNRPSRKLVGMTFQALVCLIGVIFMSPEKVRA